MSERSNNLAVRTVTGVVFVVVVLTMMLVDRGTYGALLVYVAAWCSVEFWRLARTPSQRFFGVLYIVACMVALWFFPTMGGGMSGHGGVVLAREGVPPGWDVRIAPAFIVVVWANDVFAYLTGITVGSHSMAPRLSPHKSWEGFFGGIVGATVTSALVGRFWIGGELWLWILFGLAVALAAVCGDLAESWFKRTAGVKDSGRLLPGHGGLLDRLDATLGAVPVAFLFLLITQLFR